MDRTALAAWYRRNRARSAELFGLVSDEAYYTRPIDLRHPLVFYDGHLPGFSFNTLVKKGLGRPSIDARLEALFARGIDPHESQAPGAASAWPSRDEVRAFVAEADRQVLDAIERGEIEQPGHPLLDRAEAAYAILEHEAMHQETLLYMWHRLPFDQKRAPAGYAPNTAGTPPMQRDIHVPGGDVTLGVDAGVRPFSWDNERPHRREHVPAFTVDQHKVTNAEYLSFVEGGGYQNAAHWRPEDWAWVREQQMTHPLFWEREGGRWFWRGMFGRVPLPPAWPVYVSHAEATAFANWRGRRLMTEAEFQRAACGTPDGDEREFPWGDDEPDASRGVFDFETWDLRAAGTSPAGASAWGIHDLVGGGWEWTSTVFAPFPGFTPIPSYPEYSADFFDGEHYVMKGASPATARELIRPSFRNWFRPRYPYVYAGFRTVARR
jgi:ergothioneine biosynthesis protein EgtB